MLRSRTTRQAAPPNGNGSLSSNKNNNTRQNNTNGNSVNDDDDDPRGRHSKSLLPKSLIGTLIVASVLFLVLLFTGSLSNDGRIANGSSSSSSNGNDNGNGAAKVNDGSITHVTNNKQQLRNAASLQSNNHNDKSTNKNNNTPSTTSPTTGATLHLIFSTDCSSYQHWQSYLFFHRSFAVQQPGYITRIASGCSPQQQQYEQQWHDEHVKGVMSERYRIHFTPHFSGVVDESTGEVKGDYKFFNKPFGLKHFLEEGDLLGFNNNNDKEMKHPNDIIILCDPDFALLRPITDDFSNPRETLSAPRRSAHFTQMSSHIVTHGQPYAQTYGLGTQWRKFNLDEIAGPNSPAKEVDQMNGGLFYPAGPPYIGTASDMYKIAVAWSEFAPKVYKEYPHLLAEMYAYCIAAAHLQLPHTLIDSLMISSANAGGEGWRFIHSVPKSDTCSFATQPDHSIRPLPSLIHYCQRYIVDTHYFYGKRKVPHDIFTCDHPLLEEPPMDLGQDESRHSEKDRMTAFMICAMTRMTNDAMVFFKERHCEGGGNRERMELVPHANLARARRKTDG